MFFIKSIKKFLPIPYLLLYTKFVEKSGEKWSAGGKKWSTSLEVGDLIV